MDQPKIVSKDLNELLLRIPGVVYRFHVDRDGRWRFAYVSPQVSELYEVPPEAALADHNALTQRIHPEDRDSHRRSVEEAVRNTTNWAHLHRIITSSGKLKWVLGQASPERLADGSVMWFGVLTDMTSLVEGKSQLLKVLGLYKKSLDDRQQSLNAERTELERLCVEFVSQRPQGTGQIEGQPAPDCGQESRPPPGEAPALSPRELEILRLLARGYSSKDMAAAMNVTLTTVSAHRRNLKRKLGLKSALDVTRYAMLTFPGN